MRTPLDRVLNPARHRYEWYADGKCHICRECGTAEHRNGRFYYVGRWSMSEPPCDGSHLERQAWLDASRSDDDEFENLEDE